MTRLLAFEPPGFNIGSVEIKYYALIITGAMVAALVFSIFHAKRYKMSSDFILELFIWIIPFGVIFARLAYVIFHASDFFPLNSWADFVSCINIRQGGISILGGIPGGALGAFICCKIRKKSFIEVLDMAAPAAILAQALGRWGNFVNQEVYGQLITNTKLQWFPMAVQIEDMGNQWFQATFFYEMVLNLIGFGIIVFLSRKYKKNGIIIISYLTWYLVVRAIMESIRSDAVKVGNVSVGVVGCSVGAVLVATIGALIWFNVIRTKTPSFLLPTDDVQNAQDTSSDALIDQDNSSLSSEKSEDTAIEDSKTKSKIIKKGKK